MENGVLCRYAERKTSVLLWRLEPDRLLHYLQPRAQISRAAFTQSL